MAGLAATVSKSFLLDDFTFLMAIQTSAKNAPITAPAICDEINLSVAQAAAGSQFVPKLTGGVKSIDITLGAIHVLAIAPNKPNPKQKLKILRMTLTPDNN